MVDVGVADAVDHDEEMVERLCGEGERSVQAGQTLAWRHPGCRVRARRRWRSGTVQVQELPGPRGGGELEEACILLNEFLPHSPRRVHSFISSCNRTCGGAVDGPTVDNSWFFELRKFASSNIHDCNFTTLLHSPVIGKVVTSTNFKSFKRQDELFRDKRYTRRLKLSGPPSELLPRNARENIPEQGDWAGVCAPARKKAPLCLTIDNSPVVRTPSFLANTRQGRTTNLYILYSSPSANQEIPLQCTDMECSR